MEPKYHQKNLYTNTELELGQQGDVSGQHQ